MIYLTYLICSFLSPALFFDKLVLLAVHRGLGPRGLRPEAARLVVYAALPLQPLAASDLDADRSLVGGRSFVHLIGWKSSFPSLDRILSTYYIYIIFTYVYNIYVARATTAKSFSD